MRGKVVSLYRRHNSASHSQFQETKQLAYSQRRILSGTPGTLKQRTQAGHQYWVREHVRVDGKKTDEYVGPVASTEKAVVERITREIELARALAKASGALRLFGFQRIDKKPAAVLGVLFNKKLFDAGLTLVGSHAYGALLNELGVLAPSYRTEDIDLARASRLSLVLPAGSTFHTLLKETGLEFVSVPGMPSQAPSTSFKLPGAERLAVDLLVPGDKLGASVPVPELGAHAQAIPLLDFLIDDRLQAIALSPNQVVPIRVPAPENFVLHKIFSSQKRGNRDRDKARKDLEQAAVLAAAVEDETPGKLGEAFRKLPKSGRPAVKRGCSAVMRLLDEGTHEGALDALRRIAR
jgi:hypothetical protein